MIFVEGVQSPSVIFPMMEMRSNLGEFEELVLLSVAALQDNAYGVAIRQELQEQADRKVHISAIHSALHRLELKGMLRSKMGEATQIRGGRKKRIFSITGSGAHSLKQIMQVREEFWKRIPEVVWQ